MDRIFLLLVEIDLTELPKSERTYAPDSAIPNMGLTDRTILVGTSNYIMKETFLKYELVQGVYFNSALS